MNILSSSQRMIDRAAIKRFVLAGNALFTLQSTKTAKHYTFKVRQVTKLVDNKAVPVDPPSWKVKVLRGPDNSKDYRLIGVIDAANRLIYRYSVNAHDVPYKTFQVFDWFWRQLTQRQGDAIDQCEFYHAGQCGRCGRLLTVPESVANGIGPECAQRMEFEAQGGAEGLLRQLL